MRTRIPELLCSVISARALSSFAWGCVKPVNHGHVSSATECAAVSRHQLAVAFCWVVKPLNQENVLLGWAPGVCGGSARRIASSAAVPDPLLAFPLVFQSDA